MHALPGEGRGPAATVGTGPRPSPGKVAGVTSGSRSDRPVTLAVITGAHGIGGEVKLKLFTDDISPYRSFNNGALTLTSLRGLIARFAQVPDRTAAEALRGTELTVPRAALPPLEEGEYYHADLIGLPCENDKGDTVGCVTAVMNFGAGDILEITSLDQVTFMIPINSVELTEVIRIVDYQGN